MIDSAIWRNHSLSFPHSLERPRWKGFLAAFVVVACWTGFNIVSRLGGKGHLTPYDLTALRFGVSGSAMLPVVLTVGNALTKPRLLAVMITGGLFYALLAYTGFSFAPAAHAGILINGGIPLATALLAWVWLGDRPSGLTSLALILTAGGVMVLSLGSLGNSASRSPSEWIGDLCFAGAACLWAVYGLLVRLWQIKPLDAVSGITVTTACCYLPVYFLFLPKGLSQTPIHDILLQGIYQGVVAALVASFSYAYATLSLGPGTASLMLAIVPAASAILAVPFLDEDFTQFTVAGVLLVTCGAALGASLKKTAPRPTPQAH